jgi:NAD(P)H-flavin reductase
MVPVLYRVEQLRHETGDTFTVELGSLDGSAPARFAPGQFNMLYVFGVGEAALSISGDPARLERVAHTTRIVGTVTRALGGLKRGDEVGLRGPFGTPWPLEEAAGHDVVIVAGGLGLAALRPALCRLVADRARYGRVVLLYGMRTPSDLLFRRQVEQWRGAGVVDVLLSVDRADETWPGHVGVVTTLIPKAGFDRLNTIALVSGPEVMMRFAALELEKRGVPADRIHLSLERNMKCGIGVCGHCQFGPAFVCKEGLVFRYDRVKDLLARREI